MLLFSRERLFQWLRCERTKLQKHRRKMSELIIATWARGHPCQDSSAGSGCHVFIGMKLKSRHGCSCVWWLPVWLIISPFFCTLIGHLSPGSYNLESYCKSLLSNRISSFQGHFSNSLFPAPVVESF